MNEEGLRDLFGGNNEELADGAFRAHILERLRRRERIRLIVLAAATAVGIAVALVPLWDLAIATTSALVDFVASVGDSGWRAAHRETLVVTLLLLLTFGIVRWLER